MPLPPLATAADMAAYGFDPVPDAVLLRASTRVRRAAGRQQITPGVSSVVLSGPGPWLLPQRPVVAVSSVVDASGGPVAWSLAGAVLRALDGCPSPVTVTYSHGWVTLPDELVELVCAVAARLGGLPSAVAAGARTEQAGGEAVTWGAEAWAAASDLTPAERAAVHALFPMPRLPRTIVLHS